MKLAFIIFVAFAGVLHAQTGVHRSAVSGADNMEGVRPAGWLVRSDSVRPAGSNDTLIFVNHSPGLRVKSGPPGIFWNPKNSAKGNFVLVGNLLLLQPRAAGLPGYGLFFGGKNMGTPRASYTEFLMRNDGKYSVVQHTGEKMTVLKDWTFSPGVSRHGGIVTEMAGQRIRIIADSSTVQLVVNRSLVLTLPRASAPPDGEYGVRIGSRQDLQVDLLGLETAESLQQAKPTPRPTTPLPLGKQPIRQPPAIGVQSGQRRG